MVFPSSASNSRASGSARHYTFPCTASATYFARAIIFSSSSRLPTSWTLTCAPS
jgi:hypothetical protein